MLGCIVRNIFISALYLPSIFAAQANILQDCNLVTTGDQCRVKLQSKEIIASALSPNGSLLATSSTDGTSRILNLKTGEVTDLESQGIKDRLLRLYRQKTLNDDLINSLSFSSDGKRLLTASNSNVSIHSLSDGTQTIINKGLTEGISEKQVASFSKNGQFVVIKQDSNLLRIIDLSTQENRLLKAAADKSTSFAAYVFNNLTAGIYTVEGYAGSVPKMVVKATDFERDETVLMPYSDEFKGKPNKEGHLIFAALSHTTKGGLKLINTERYVKIYGTRNSPAEYCYATILTNFNDSNAKPTLLTYDPLCENQSKHKYIAQNVVFSQDGSRFAVAYQSELVKVFNDKGETQISFSFGENSIAALAISADGKYVIAAASNGTILLGNLDSRAKKSIASDFAATSIVFTPNVDEAIVTGKNGEILIIKLKDKNENSMKMLHNYHRVN